MHSPFPYRGRFAPSPTGPLHAGSLVAALASWLDARAHGGQWLVRIEDVDTPRTVPGADCVILDQLQRCGLAPDEAPQWQSQRTSLYRQALQSLQAAQLAYPCHCSRQHIAFTLAAQGQARARNRAPVYPGTCRPAPHGPSTQNASGMRETPAPNVGACAWRLNLARLQSLQSCGVSHCEENQTPCPMDIRHIATETIAFDALRWEDRRLGPQLQNLLLSVGDFVLQRADGCATYQLAVVVDDAAQSITHVVRGEDLADNTARQIALQRALNHPTPRYLHTPLVLGPNGEKLSKQNGAQALALDGPTGPLSALNQAAAALGLQAHSGSVADALARWVPQFAARMATAQPAA